jgi:hypothetical protein
MKTDVGHSKKAEAYQRIRINGNSQTRLRPDGLEKSPFCGAKKPRSKGKKKPRPFDPDVVLKSG